MTKHFTPLQDLPLELVDRWYAAKALLQSIKDSAAVNNAEIFYRDTIIKPEQIEIDENSIYVRHNPHSRTMWFEVAEDWDHGLYTPMEEFADNVRTSFSLAKRIAF